MKKTPEKFDCEQPLNNPKHEAFCQTIAKGRLQPDAYRQAGYEVSEESANAAASRLAARPEVKARLKALQLAGITGTGPVTPDELIKKIEMIVRTPGANADTLKAIKMLDEQTGIFAEIKQLRGGAAKPDPCAILAYVVSFAGMTGEQIVNSLGGKEFMACQLSDILKIPVIVDGVAAA